MIATVVTTVATGAGDVVTVAFPGQNREVLHSACLGGPRCGLRRASWEHRCYTFAPEPGPPVSTVTNATVAVC
jgi:hypothetical protein